MIMMKWIQFKIRKHGSRFKSNEKSITMWVGRDNFDSCDFELA